MDVNQISSKLCAVSLP